MGSFFGRLGDLSQVGDGDGELHTDRDAEAGCAGKGARIWHLSAVRLIMMENLKYHESGLQNNT